MIKIISAFLIIVFLVVVYFISPNSNKVPPGVHLIDESELEGSANTNILGDIDEEYLKVIDKVKRGEALTKVEMEQIDQQRIRNLEKIDTRAAELERELQTKGYLAEEDYKYLTSKREELSRLVAIELIKEHRENK